MVALRQTTLQPAQRAWAFALLVLAVTTVALTAGLPGTGTVATPQFLSTALGQPQADAPLSRQPAAGVTARVDRNGYTVRRNGSALTLSSPVDGLPATLTTTPVTNAQLWGNVYGSAHGGVCNAAASAG